MEWPYQVDPNKCNIIEVTGYQPQGDNSRSGPRGVFPQATFRWDHIPDCQLDAKPMEDWSRDTQRSWAQMHDSDKPRAYPICSFWPPNPGVSCYIVIDNTIFFSFYQVVGYYHNKYLKWGNSFAVRHWLWRECHNVYWTLDLECDAGEGLHATKNIVLESGGR